MNEGQAQTNFPNLDAHYCALKNEKRRICAVL